MAGAFKVGLHHLNARLPAKIDNVNITPHTSTEVLGPIEIDGFYPCWYQRYDMDKRAEADVGRE